MKPDFWYCELYKMNFWYFIGWPRESFDQWIRKRHDQDYETAKLSGAKTLLIENSDGQRIAIWVKKQPRPNMMASLCHECVHAAHWTLDLRGHKPDYNNDEPEAYLTEAIFRNGMA
jgi:hypothetical protein